MRYRYIALPHDSNGHESFGSKAARLAALRSVGMSIPPWFVLVPQAFNDSLGAVSVTSSKTSEQSYLYADSLNDLRLLPEAQNELKQALRDLCPSGEQVAVRSSALEEDGNYDSFAGQLDTFLSVQPDAVPNTIPAVWRSAFSRRIMSYRAQRGRNHWPKPPAVLVQRMVHASASGVAFGADPLTGRRGVAVIAASVGLGHSLVSGECNGDTYYVDREGRVIHQDVAGNGEMNGSNGSGSGEPGPKAPQAAFENRAVLTNDQICAVANLVRQVGRYFDRPQDIEWAIEGRDVYLLQARPITALTEVPDPDSVPILWDNSNISESYGGVTTPLTFSFARKAYEGVYRQFCMIMGVSEESIADHDRTFHCMLGLIRGRIYYNLMNWYRVLALLPGFRINRRFMEQMMGVRESIPDDLLPPSRRRLGLSVLGDGVNVFKTTISLMINHFLLSRTIRRFYQRLNEALQPPSPPLEDMRSDELLVYYRDLERKLITRWDAPLLNDFFTMIFNGVLRRLTPRWCGDSAGALHNDLLCAQEGMVSAKPVQRIRRIADSIASDPRMVDVFLTGTMETIQVELAHNLQLSNQVQDYLCTFGERYFEELKLESPTLMENPLQLFRSIGQVAQNIQQRTITDPSETGQIRRRRAEGNVKVALSTRPWRTLVFSWVLDNARDRIRDRENLRFERTRLFARVRKIFLELGRRLYTRNLLDAPRDVFFLEVGEVLGTFDGTTSCSNLKALVAIRKEEFGTYRTAVPPPDRFQTRGDIHYKPRHDSRGTRLEVGEGDFLKGIGCCPGVVRGPVRVVTDPFNTNVTRGDILVTQRTDPGWIVLLPSAAGLLVERGSLLSHSAIIARELGIPTIVSLTGVLQWVQDGEHVELDGGSGIVKKIDTRNGRIR